MVLFKHAFCFQVASVSQNLSLICITHFAATIDSGVNSLFFHAYHFPTFPIQAPDLLDGVFALRLRMICVHNSVVDWKSCS